MSKTLIAGGPERDVLTVSQLNRKSKQLLETHFPLLWVDGELSSLAQPSSGHWYFTLKDEKAQVRCAMFRSRNRAVRFSPKQGQQLLVRARVSLYEGRGDYQLIVEHMEEAGSGALQRAFDELKHRLNREGLFAQELKQTLPRLPNHLAVITSPTGAAIRDVLSVLKRRFPGLPVTVIPVPVQGPDAAPAIVRALEMANEAQLFDALLLTRGGGSLEDLWPFNEEAVARAIHQSALPVVSAVGHEVDFSISDFVADLRAPTPSAAAELLVPEAEEYRTRFRHCAQRLAQALLRRLRAERHHLHHFCRRLRHPGDRLNQQYQRLDELELRLGRAISTQMSRKQQALSHLMLRQRALRPKAQLARWRTDLNQLSNRLTQGLQRALTQRQQRLSEASRLLNSVSPLNTLERGYAIVTRPDDGQIIRSHQELEVGDVLKTRLGKGGFTSRVTARIEDDE